MAHRSGVAGELTVGEVAARSGVAVSALHFYEAKGLIRGLRTAGNQRRYPRDVLRRIAVILASSLASAVAVNEVASWMETVGSTSFRFFETFVVAAIVYLVLCQAVNLLRLLIGHLLFRRRVVAR